MNTKATFAAIAILVGSVFTCNAFAQSGTITFTGSIVAPACTGSASVNSDANAAAFDVSLDQCANSQAQVIRTSVDSTNANASNVTAIGNNSAIVTVSYE